MVDPYALNDFIAHYALRPAYFHPANLFTSMFLHGGWMHVLGNMLVPVGFRGQRRGYPGALANT